MKSLKILLITTVAATALIACGPSADTRSVKKLGKTTIVKIGDLQFAFDVETMAEHAKMMKQMGSDSGHGNMKMPAKMEPKAKHYVSLSIMNKAKKAPVKNAEVTYHVTGPDGKTENLNGKIMSGKGMHHYAAGFNTPKKGEYTIKADITINSKKYTEKVKHTIK